jgi:hypothetical protein
MTHMGNAGEFRKPDGSTGHVFTHGMWLLDAHADESGCKITVDHVAAGSHTIITLDHLGHIVSVRNRLTPTD